MNSVMMLVNEYAPLQVGGAERQAERLSKYLIDHGWMVSVITRRYPGLLPIETMHGVTIIRPPAFGPNKLKTVSFVLGTLWILWQKRMYYQILHAHLAFGPAFAAVIAARLLRKRSLIKLGNSGKFGDIQRSMSTLRGQLRLAVLRRWADVILVLDKEMEAEALSVGFDARRVQIISNGINSKSFATKHSRETTRHALGAQDRVIVLYVGRLTAQKSLPDLLNAFARALTSCPALHLVLLGDGPERFQLEAQAQGLKIDKQVTFAGSQQDVLPYLSAADMFVLPSVSEGISNALLEAMSARLACIATPVGGNRDLLDNGQSGLLIPVGDIDGWAGALVQLARDTDLREKLGSAAQQRVLDRFDFEVVGSTYQSLYRDLSPAS